MPRETADAKALRLLADGRARILRAVPGVGVALDVRGDSNTFAAPYRVLVFRRAGRIEQSCTCACPTAKCSHLRLGRLLAAALGVEGV